LERVLKKYNLIGDELFYHHTVTPPIGRDYVHEPEVHRQYELLYLKEGRISYVIDGKTYKARSGDIILVSPGELHTIRIDGSRAYERIVILFDMELFKRMLEEIKLELSLFSEGTTLKFHITKSDAVKKYGIDAIVKSIIATEGEEKHRRLLIVAKLLELLAAFDRMAKDSGEPDTTPDSEDRLVRRVADYVEEHIAEKMTLDSIAAALFVSKSTLCHRFTAYMRISVNKYIAARRMTLAADLIKRGATAQEASAAVGYENYSAFFHVFKKTYGIPPTALRERQ